MDWISPLGLRFFGLTPEYRVALFRQIHEIVFHGNGGYDWETVYKMPIWLRRFTFQRIKEYYEEQSKQAEKVTQAANRKTPSKPTYSTKARR